MTTHNILEIIAKLDDAFNRKDINAILEFYDDAATMVVEPGKSVSGKKSLRNVFKKIFKFNYIAKQEKMQVIEAGDLALFISKWHLFDESENKIEAIRASYATCVFRKNQHGKWKLVIDNSFGPDVLNIET